MAADVPARGSPGHVEADAQKGGGPDAPERQPDVFLSYSRRDREFVRALHARLVARGKRVYVDWDDIPAWSPDWDAELLVAIEEADIIVCVLSPAAADSPTVRREIEHAAAQHKRIHPILHRDVAAERVPQAARVPQWIDARDPAGFDAVVDRLMSALDTDVDWVREHTRLLTRANEWRRRGDERSLLLGGRDLAGAEAWLARQAGREPVPTALQMQYVLAARRAQGVRQRKVLGATLTALAITAALAVVALVLRDQAASQRDRANSRAFAASAESQLTTDPQLGLLLARRARTVADTAEATDALRSALFASDVRVVIGDRGAGVRGVAVSPDGALVVTAGEDKIARVWDARSGLLLRSLRGHEDRVRGVAFSPDGLKIATAAEDETARLWDAQTGRLLDIIDGHSGAVTAVSFSSDGRQVLTASTDHLAATWDVETLEPVHAFVGHSDAVVAARFDSSDSQVVTGSTDGTARIWDADTGTAKKVLRGDQDLVTSVDFGPGGRQVVTGGFDGTARVWEGPRWHIVATLVGHSGPVLSTAFSDSDTGLIVTGGFDGTARLWKTGGGLPVGETVEILRGHSDSVWDARFSPDGSTVISASGDGTARNWAVRDSQLAHLRGLEQSISQVAFSRDGRRVAGASRDGTARVWDARTRELLTLLDGQAAAVHAVAFAPRADAVLLGDRDGKACVWAVPGGERRRCLSAHRGDVFGVAFSPDGRQAVTAGRDGAVRVSDVGSGRPLRTIPAHADSAYSASFSPDGRLVASASADKTAKVWDWRSGRLLVTLRGKGGSVHGAEFSPDGRFLVTTPIYGTTQVWDWRRRALTSELRAGQLEQNLHATFSPDGNLVLTSGLGAPARVWDWRRARSLGEIRGPDAWGQSAAFSPDARRVVVGHQDHSVRIYACEECAGRETLDGLAARRTVRRLTSAERARFAGE